MIRRIYRIALLGATVLVLAVGVALRLQDAGFWSWAGSGPSGGRAWGPADDEGRLKASFLGQDGTGLVGIGCTRDDTPDNIHISVTGLRTDVEPEGWEVTDPAGSGLWALPCNGRNWWLDAMAAGDGTAQLYLKPHRDAPDGTRYRVTVLYPDGSAAYAVVEGSAVRVWDP